MTTRARLVGLAATLATLGIVAGLPAALLTLAGNPIPASLPSLEQARAALTSPDDGTLALTAITLIGWAAWAVLTIAILAEATARARRVRAPHLPGLALPQAGARQLVAAAALLFTITPTTAGAATATPHPATAMAAAQVTALTPVTAPAPPHDIGQPSVATVTTPTPSHQQPKGGGAGRGYTVRPGDTLTGIAGRQLGDPGRWRELAAQNPAVAAHPDLIHPGTRLTLPAAPRTATAHTYVVRPGDTLSGIAQRELGDPSRWPEIYQASRHTIQPGGTRITDPDRIDTGQRLTIPAATRGLASATAAPPARPETTPRTAAPSPTHRPDPHPPAPAPARSVPATPTPASTAATSPPAVSPVPDGAAHATPHAGAPDQTGEHEPDQQTVPVAWLLAGLTGSGALLAGSMLLLLRRRRRAASRHRRPGRTLTAPAPVLGPVEKTLTTIGTVTAPTIEYMDAVLRRLAATAAEGGTPMPELAAVELTGTDLVLHLASPADLPGPWTPSPDRYHHSLPGHTPPEQVGPEIPDQPAPYPLLVTIGLGPADQVWLLNLEDLHVTITGDPTYGDDLARYLTAELACNPWSAGVEVTCLGLATELAALSPDRIHAHDLDDPGSDPIGEYLAEAVHTIDRAGDTGTDVTTARAVQAGADPWPARVLLLDAATEHPALDQLLNLLRTHPGRTATAVILHGPHAGTPDTAGTVLQVNADGHLTLPDAGLRLVAVGLTSDEAQGCAALLAHADTTTDVPVPVDENATDGWRGYTDLAGALREQHTTPRHQQNDPDPDDPGDSDIDDPDAGDVGDLVDAGGTLLTRPDRAYLDAAATTSEDLQVLAPRVPPAVRARIEDADPSLDDDVAMWFRDDAALPKLHLLGPVRATTRGTPLTRRKPYMTELLAFIALRPHGATPEEVAHAFNITKSKARDYALTLRQWLGTNPRTGDPHLPDARHAPAAAIRDVPVYEVLDLLVDIDLFRRLRARGQARGGPTGITDLVTALRLVDGRPFDYPVEREAAGGWAWLLDDRLDGHLAVAIVDTAHTVTTHALTEADLPTARLAAETAALAAPHEEIPRLDLAAVAAAEGHHAEANQIIRDQIASRTDDDRPPPELPARTEQILHHLLGRRDRWAG